MDETPNFYLLVFEMFLTLICIWLVLVSVKNPEESMLKRMALVVGIVAGIAAIFLPIYLYVIPYGFSINAPVTQLHVYMENGNYAFEYPEPSSPHAIGIALGNITMVGNETTYEEPIYVVDNSWQVFGYYLKPYNKVVTLYIQNRPPPGIDVAIASNPPYIADIGESPKISDTPPFNGKIKFKIRSNATLHGTYYITLKGIGQDEKTGLCQFVLTVGPNRERRGIVGFSDGADPSKNTVRDLQIIFT